MSCTVVQGVFNYRYRTQKWEETDLKPYRNSQDHKKDEYVWICLRFYPNIWHGHTSNHYSVSSFANGKTPQFVSMLCQSVWFAALLLCSLSLRLPNLNSWSQCSAQNLGHLWNFAQVQSSPQLCPLGRFRQMLVVWTSGIVEIDIASNLHNGHLGVQVPSSFLSAYEQCNDWQSSNV